MFVLVILGQPTFWDIAGAKGRSSDPIYVFDNINRVKNFRALAWRHQQKLLRQ